MTLDTVFSPLAIFFVKVYQLLVQPMIEITLRSTLGHYSSCKHSPTCSEYTIIQIRNHGTITGLKRGVVRIAQCR